MALVLQCDICRRSIAPGEMRYTYSVTYHAQVNDDRAGKECVKHEDVCGTCHTRFLSGSFGVR